MGFDLYVGDEYRTNPVLLLPQLVHHIRLYVPRLEHNLDTLLLMCTRDGEEYEPEIVLQEAQTLKRILIEERRPYIAAFGARHDTDYIGVRNYPALLGDAQLVTDWVRMDPVAPGVNVIIRTGPPTLLSSRGKVYLVNATIGQLLRSEGWAAFPHVSARTFQWTQEGLFADGRRCEEAPAEFREDVFDWKHIRFCEVAVYDAWSEEIEGLIAAGTDARDRGVKIRTSL